MTGSPRVTMQGESGKYFDLCPRFSGNHGDGLVGELHSASITGYLFLIARGRFMTESQRHRFPFLIRPIVARRRKKVKG